MARVASEVAAAAVHAAFVEKRRPESVIAARFRTVKGLSLEDRRFVGAAVASVFRWWGWIEPLELGPIEAKLLLAVLLDHGTVPGPCRAWAHEVGVDPSCLVAIGNAPGWPSRADAFRRLVENPRATTDPWRLFPSWLKDVLLTPPGESSPKYLLTGLLETLQREPPLWVRVARGKASAAWEELRSQGVTPRIHRRLTDAASLPAGTLLQAFESYRRGDLVPMDLAMQAVVAACDAEPGERWWLAGSDLSAMALDLADRMIGKGTIVSSELDRREQLRNAHLGRKSPHTNLEGRPWDGRHVDGKEGRYHGVLLAPPTTGVGTWRREPVARWFVDRRDLDGLVAEQDRLLGLAARGVRPSGVLVYAARTLTATETTDRVARFLADHPEFALDPFPDPLGGGPTDGTALIWPDRADSDGMFIARFIRVAAT